MVKNESRGLEQLQAIFLFDRDALRRFAARLDTLSQTQAPTAVFDEVVGWGRSRGLGSTQWVWPCMAGVSTENHSLADIVDGALAAFPELGVKRACLWLGADAESRSAGLSLTPEQHCIAASLSALEDSPRPAVPQLKLVEDSANSYERYRGLYAQYASASLRTAKRIGRVAVAPATRQ